MTATLLLVPEKKAIAINEHASVDVMLDTGNQPINAVSGSIVYDPAALDIVAIVRGNSLINFWVVDPAASANHGTIEFSGVVPGGTTTAHGQLFSIVFSGIKKGNATIAIADAETYLNDGLGTKAGTQSKGASIAVSATVAETKPYALDDTTPPEHFAITRTRDETLFDNQWFVVFAAQDKGSGIAQYELCESFFKQCETAESPALLRSQSSLYAVRVKAYDQNGNVQTASLLSPLFIFFACAAGVLAAILVLYVARSKNARSKRKKKNNL